MLYGRGFSIEVGEFALRYTFQPMRERCVIRESIEQRTNLRKRKTACLGEPHYRKLFENPTVVTTLSSGSFRAGKYARLFVIADCRWAET